jgi:nucleoside-diphosphate-sugar epimerase
MKQKTILVTGATGLLGSNLLKHLLQKDYSIYALKRANSDTSACPTDSRINWVINNSLSADFLEVIPEPIHCIIHVAGLVSYHKKDRNQLLKVNRDFTKSLAEAALKNRVEKFIFISSIAALGKNSPEGVITEKTPYNEKQFNSYYGKSKRAAEGELKRIGDKGLNWIILNPSIIVGAAKPAQSSAQLIYYVADEKPFYTEGTLNYIGVDDVSRIILQSIENKWANKQWIASAGALSYKDFFHATAKILNTKPPFIKIPKGGVLIGAILENIWSKITGKTPSLTMETAKMAGKHHNYSNELLIKDLNFEFTPFEQVLEKAVREIQQRGYSK